MYHYYCIIRFEFFFWGGPLGLKFELEKGLHPDFQLAKRQIFFFIFKFSLEVQVVYLYQLNMGIVHLSVT